MKRMVMISLMVIAVVSLGVTAQATAIIYPDNYSFESPDTAGTWQWDTAPTSWTLTKAIGGLSPDEYLRGDYSMSGQDGEQIVCILSSGSDARGSDELSQAVPSVKGVILPNTLYSLSVSIGNHDIGAGYHSGGATIQLYAFDGTTATLLTDLAVSGSTIDTAGNQFVRYTTPDWNSTGSGYIGQQFLVELFVAGLNINPNETDLDNVFITGDEILIPEPGVMGLMVLGGLLMVLRRRNQRS